MKKIPLRVIFAAVCGLFLLAVTVVMARRLIINHSFVSDYEQGNYQVDKEKSLLTMNFPESYVPLYNLGNASYKLGDYNSAISYYTKALEMYPPEAKECDIRVNLALSLCDTIDFYHLDSQDKIDTALFILYKARDVLTEKGCAAEAEGEKGHDPEAQQLKEDIDEMIKKLQNPDQNGSNGQQEQNSSSDDSDSSSGGGSGPSEREKKVQGELEGKKKDAMEDRKDQQGTLEKYSDFIGGDEEGGGNGDVDGSGSGDGEGGSGKQVNPW